ncbi:hypothetical protein B484DRAFT_408099 [Ochromonadaceae sp. CCMP2298]|nr:hypothetical protein B484DRAFT_408099 [Ochromonadaceae sp. CCMP2298]
MPLQKRKGRRIIVNVNAKLLYAENHIWSQRYQLWNRYRVKKPRLPKETDKTLRIVDDPDNGPKTFGTFAGNHNYSCIQALSETLTKFESIRSFPEVLCVCGPSGSGKSALSRVFVNGMIDAVSYKPSQVERWLLSLDANEYKKDMSALWARVTKFAEAPFEKWQTVKYRVVVVDNFHLVPPSSQQTLKKIIERFSVLLKYLFVCPDPSKCMTGFLLNKTISIKTRSIGEKDALRVVLQLCYQHRMGFEREGIQHIFKQFPDRSLSKMLDLAQRVFVEQQYMSKENVVKVLTGTARSDLPVLTQHRSLEPFPRCPLCTLYPPCQHTSLELLLKQGIQRRVELPRYKTGSMSCPTFVRYGYCTMFNRTGHCSLDHPKNLHIIKKHQVRCGQCSIPWPCGHCDYSKHRQLLLDTLAEIQTRLGRIRAINVPEPPVSLTRHLHIGAGGPSCTSSAD